MKTALILLALHGSALFDSLSSVRSEPLPCSTMYLGTDGLHHIWHDCWKERNPLLGPHPSNVRIMFQIQGDALVADWMLMKRRPHACQFAYGVIAEHMSFGIHNTATPRPFQVPICWGCSVPKPLKAQAIDKLR